MKKYNKKQIAYSRNKAILYRNRILGILFFSVLFAFMGPAIYGGFTTGDWTPFYALLFGGSAVGKFATMASIGNVKQPSDIDTAPNQIGFRMWLASTDQLDEDQEFPTPAANSRDISSIPLADGEYFHYMDGIKDSLKFTSTGEKGDITSTFNKTFSIVVVHNDQTLNFVETYQGRGFIQIYKECESSNKYLLGSRCKPMYLTSFETKEDGDGKYITLTFTNSHWRQPLNYTGSITTAEPVTLDADATTLAIESGNDNYTLTVPSSADVTISAVSGIASSDVGRTITVKAPATSTNVNSIADNDVFILKDGETWTANPGSSIVFEIFDTDTLIELSRVETA